MLILGAQGYTELGHGVAQRNYGFWFNRKHTWSVGRDRKDSQRVEREKLD
jgi:hypothetical protein